MLSKLFLLRSTEQALPFLHGLSGRVVDGRIEIMHTSDELSPLGAVIDVSFGDQRILSRCSNLRRRTLHHPELLPCLLIGEDVERRLSIDLLESRGWSESIRARECKVAVLSVCSKRSLAYLTLRRVYPCRSPSTTITSNFVMFSSSQAKGMTVMVCCDLPRWSGSRSSSTM